MNAIPYQCERCGYGLHDAAYLCRGCADEATEQLGEFADMYERLGEMMLPGSRAYHGGGRRPVVGGAPTSVSVIDSRTGFNILSTWHGALFQSLGWDPPGFPDDGAARVAAAVKALRDNMLWIAGSWPAAGDFAREVANLHRDAASIVGAAERGQRAGLCPTVRDGQVCGAPLRLPPGGTVIDCKWCGASWGPTRWIELRLAQGKGVAA